MSTMIPTVTATPHVTENVVDTHSGSPAIGCVHSQNRSRVNGSKLTMSSSAMAMTTGSKMPRSACSAWIRPRWSGSSAQATT